MKVHNLVTLLRSRIDTELSRPAYTFLLQREQEESRWAYVDLDRQARRIASMLQQQDAVGERVLLLYPSGLEFLAAFFGCLYAGAIAVPAYPPGNKRHLPRIETIVKDSQAKFILTLEKTQSKIEGWMESASPMSPLTFMSSDSIPPGIEDSWVLPEIDEEGLAFLQYTSGSTALPKGVMVSHCNLLHNLKNIQRAFESTQESLGMIWLPPFHDMGLIGGLLAPLFVGFPVVLMSPSAFLQRPVRWLEAISRYRATVSGGPNFAYDLCVTKISEEQRADLDLSCWKLAFSGAEPVRPETLERFSRSFGSCGFRKQAFYPCYGLAESTLFVAGGQKSESPIVRNFNKQALERHLAHEMPVDADDSFGLVSCGRNLPEQEIIIVEPEEERICSDGHVGEIWLSSPSVSLGYWQKPEATQASFHASLHGKEGGHFLRTGDLGFLKDGELYVTGRLKDMIILRGRNYYPQDFEWTAEHCHFVIRRHSSAAFVVTIEEQEHLVLVAEIERRHKERRESPRLDSSKVYDRRQTEIINDPGFNPESRESFDLDLLIKKIRQTLAEQHGVQLYAVSLLKHGSISRTSSGKIQRHACKERFERGELNVVAEWTAASGGRVASSSEYEAPRSDTEKILVSLWEEVLGVEAIGIRENFFALGGDSLSGNQLISRLQERFQVNVPFDVFFEKSNIVELAELLDSSSVPLIQDPFPPLQVVPRRQRLPLSRPQQRLWFFQQLQAGNALHNIVVAWQLVGSLQRHALEKSFNEIVKRHEILRTNVMSVKGIPEQIIHPERFISLSVDEFQNFPEDEQAEKIQAEIQREKYTPFNLETDALLRIRLLKCAEEKHWLVLAVHHIVSDGWSMGILAHELRAFYDGFCRGESPTLPPLTVQYADFAFWQQQADTELVFKRHQPYWERQLAHTPQRLELPGDYPRTSLQSISARHENFELSSDLSQKLRQMSHQHESTLFMTLLTAFSLLLARYAAQEEFLIGSPVSGRKHAECEKLIGMFAYPIVLRTDMAGNPTFRELLTRVRHVALEAYAHQDFPFGKLVEVLKPERNEGYHPLIQVMFSFLDQPVEELKFSALTLDSVQLENEAAEFDLFLLVTQANDRLQGDLQYNDALFRPETIRILVEWFREILQRVIESPETRFNEFSIPQKLQGKISTVKQAAHAQTLAISANFTAESLKDVLVFWMEQSHLPSQVTFAPYNQVFQQLLDPSSLLAQNRQGFNIILLRLEEWLTPSQSIPADRQSQDKNVEKNLRDFVSALQGASERSTVPYLLCLCPASPVILADGGRTSLLARMENRLLGEVEDIPGVSALLSTDIAKLYPLQEYYDSYSDREGHVPFTPAFFAALGTTIVRRMLAMKREPYKVIVLDCDNTLWKGVCGEAGALGIRLDPPYLALQACMLEQREAGMLLCLGSKNSEEDVFEVFDRRPEMILKREHLVAKRINWRPKSENLIAMAEELNLGLNSFIFVDDNPLECAEVQSSCPEVLTLQLPSEPERIPQFLQHVWAFDHPKITEEDKQRSTRYQQSMQRERSRRESLTFQHFLEQLELKLAIHPIEAAQLPRVAQLTQRTNQFNLTTIRRTEQEIQTFCEAEGGECLVTELSDRFGEYGLVGVVLFKDEAEDLVVDSFLLSCRALGRGVEHNMLAEVGRLALQRGMERVDVAYVQSPKNRPAFDFLESIGQPFKHEVDQGCLFRFPAQAAADVTFQAKGEEQADRQETEGRKQKAGGREWEPRQSTFEESGRLLNRIASELYDIEQILSVISAQKERMRSDDLDSRFVAPRSSVEKELADIWTELLGIDRVGIYDDFFQLGGHSLLATQILSRVMDRFHIELPLQSLLNEPSIAGIAEQISKQEAPPKQKHETVPQQETIRPVPRDLPVPLSFAQERQWFFQQLEPDSAVYNVAANARLTGELNIEALKFGIQEIVRRHESLRTRFVALETGMPVQIVEPDVAVELPLEDLSVLSDEEREAKIQRLIAEEIQRPFDLTHCPLFRFSLLRLHQQEHLLLATMHHIISDEWSVVVFLRELSVLYDAFLTNMPAPLPLLSIQYADFAHWQRQQGRSDLFEKQLTYWKQQLRGLPPMLDLPTDRPRPSTQSYHGASQAFALPQTISKILKKLSRQENATMFMTLIAAFNVLLYRYSGSEDIAVGFPIANRNQMKLEPLIGFFVNTLVLRTDLSGEPGFRELLRQSKELSAEAQDNQDLPFERVVAELHPKRELSYNPLFQVMFVWYTTLPDVVQLPDLLLTPLEAEDRLTMFDLTLLMEEAPDGLRGKFIYNCALFDAATIGRMAGHFCVLLEGIVNEPDQKISLLPLLTDAEEQTLLTEWNRTQTAYPDHVCIQQLFEAQVERSPNAVALVFGAEELSYRQLNRQANQMAGFLRNAGVGPEIIVGICVERSFAMIIGVLAILKAGGAYLPLDPDYPETRLTQMLEDAEAPFLLTQESFLSKFPAYRGQSICLDVEQTRFAQELARNLPLLSGSQNLAYVIYTSGSTGRPKGTLLEHRSLCNLVAAQCRIFHVRSDSRLLQFVSLSFDVATGDIFMALCSGAALCLIEKPSLLTGEQFVEHLRRCRITHTELPVSLLQSLPFAELPDLQVIITGGERCPIHVVEQWAEGRRFFNAYGPTESTVCVTSAEYRSDRDVRQIPIGRPFPNITIYVLDAAFQPVPIGVPGELYLGGVGLARGYLNQPEITEEKFLPNPFGGSPGDRLYKTGDLVRYLPDGNLEFLGRVDHQVKLRGFRIELEEIEKALAAHPAVRENVVIAREDTPGDKRLIAYIVTDQSPPPAGKLFREYLQALLPVYMVPSAFVPLEILPLTPNGKIDRRALAALEYVEQDRAEQLVVPRTPLERQLADIWQDVLQLEHPGIDDNFFEIGGHSLLATQMVAKITKSLHRALSVQELFEHPTIAGLASILEQKSRLPEGGAPDHPELPGTLRPPLDVDVLLEERRLPSLQIERRPLLPLFLIEELAPVDAVALSYLTPEFLENNLLDRERIIRDVCHDLPVLSGVLETPWGRIGYVTLPRFPDDLFHDTEDGLRVMLDALKIAKAIGARVVSLTGILPSATQNGEALVQAMKTLKNFPEISTGHATICATIILTLQQLVKQGGRDLSRERVALLGSGSLALGVVRLMLDKCPHPEELVLCDLYSNPDVLEAFRQELVQNFGFQGKIRILISQQELPSELYEASCILAATNLPNALDVTKVRSGTLILDNLAGQRCMDVGKAIRRLEEQQDILFSEGDVLSSPLPLKELRFLPPFVEYFAAQESIESLLHHTPSKTTGCVLSSLLSANFEDLPPTQGGIDRISPLKHYDRLQELEFQAAGLHLGTYALSAEFIEKFQQRFSHLSSLSITWQSKH